MTKLYVNDEITLFDGMLQWKSLNGIQLLHGENSTWKQFYPKSALCFVRWKSLHETVLLLGESSTGKQFCPGAILPVRKKLARTSCCFQVRVGLETSCTPKLYAACGGKACKK